MRYIRHSDWLSYYQLLSMIGYLIIWDNLIIMVFVIVWRYNLLRGFYDLIYPAMTTLYFKVVIYLLAIIFRNFIIYFEVMIKLKYISFIYLKSFSKNVKFTYVFYLFIFLYNCLENFQGSFFRFTFYCPNNYKMKVFFVVR